MSTIKTKSWLARNEMQVVIAEGVKRLEALIETNSKLIASGTHDPEAVDYFRDQMKEAKAAAQELRSIKVALTTNPEPKP